MQAVFDRLLLLKDQDAQELAGKAHRWMLNAKLVEGETNDRALYADMNALIEKVEALELPALQVRLLRDRSAMCLRMGDFDQAMANIGASVEMAWDNELYLDAGIGSEQLSRMCQQTGDTMTAFEHLKSALSAYKGGEHWGELGATYQQIAQLLLQNGQVQEGVATLGNALEVYDLAEDPESKGFCHQSIARIQRTENNLEDAAYHYQLSVACFEVGGNHTQVADAYLQAGMLQEELEQFEDAMASYKKALVYAEQSEEETLMEGIQDSIEELEEDMMKRKPKDSNGSKGDNGGIFSKIRGIFGK